MDFPWIPLIFNMVMLGIVLFVCRTINAANGQLLWNGALIYFVFAVLAMALDFALTMIFASASFHDNIQYERLASRTAWSDRILGYVIPCAVSLVLARSFRKRQRSAKPHSAGESADASYAPSQAAS
ncbi:hypothetical protein [Caballeronia sp. Lep1P3]|uniref:hypothetical protein n=1 Tax=Caballeronia sp. Lep1P3 TaxID=2878150 RepID=UPI001FD08D09|nr:hypothetical protein [Caballeronia sp. Lep1P3]